MIGYEGNDPGICLFLASLQAGAPMPITSGQRVLELGCCEEDWLHEIGHARWPQTHFVGLDWRAPDVVDADGMVTRIRGNGLDPDRFAPESFDGIVSLSAVEHFGLGHYHDDPADVDGDTSIIANCWKWLKPGGWLYFDVPYDPRKTWTNGTEYRAYDYWGLWDRLWVDPLVRAKAKAQWLWTGYAPADDCRQLCAQPTTQPDDRLAYYVAMCWQKIG